MISVGDKVQWKSQGVDQFAEPKLVVLIIENYAFVEGSKTGLPIEQLRSLNATH